MNTQNKISIVETQYLSAQQKQHFRDVESLLIGELHIDKDDSFHIARMLNCFKCLQILETCVLPVYCKKIYTDLVYPVYLYLEYSNNYLSLKTMINDRDCFGYDSVDEALPEIEQLVSKGRAILNGLNENKS